MQSSSGLKRMCPAQTWSVDGPDPNRHQRQFEMDHTCMRRASSTGIWPSTSQDPAIDGISHWESISQGLAGNRTEFIYNLDDVVVPPGGLNEGHAGIRVGDWKLIGGYPGHDSGWYPPDKNYETNETPEAWYQRFYSDGLEYLQNIKAGNESYYKLFNLKEDPTEHNDLAKEEPEIVSKLAAKMAEYHKLMIPAKDPPPDPKSNPKYHGGVWTPGWCAKPME